VSPAENRGKEKEKVKAKSESKSKAKGKGKEAAGNRRRKRSDNEAYRDIYHDLTAESLVQQVMRNIMSTEAMLTCQLSAGVGTSRPS